QYLDTIKDHIQEQSSAIVQLKADLEKQKAEMEIAIKQQSDLSQALAIQQAEAAQILSVTRGEEGRYAQLASANNAKAEELKRQQAAIISSQFGRGSTAGSCGGGYPAKWCNAPQDSLVDDWGMYNRECVSYTAFKVASSGRYMPYWGGRGNAKQWPDNARAAGIPVDGNPRAGDVAASLSGPYGHVMYVERVNGNGTIDISQYNAENQGLYSTNTISASGLQFIHF
ncbi:MAG TPA: CHAP domain-containing protein, partial [Candidatus Dormibacteraeota bacterium]|nr:CHAP domain-containing protein [Candidatus Dormibacteraeota bacterium]